METHTSGLVIDWRLLLLQAGNFLLLLAILTWLVWKPLLRLIEDRRRNIAEGVAAAEASKLAAAEAESIRQTLLAEARRQATQLVTETKAELVTERERVKAELTAEREKLSAEATTIVRDERARMERALRQHASRLVTQAVTKLLAQTPDRDRRWETELAQAVKDVR